MRQQQPVLAGGLRSVAVAGDVTNSVIVTGDDVTVELRVDGDDALLAELLTGSRVPRRTPRPRPLDGLPAPSPEHVDREAEAQSVRAAVATRATLEIHGAADIGKTFVVRHALAHRAGTAGLPDGVVYVFARGKAYGDILQELFEAFFACDPPAIAGEQQVRRDLAGMQALLVLDSLDLPRGDIRELVAALPACRFVLVGRDRPLGEGARVAITGLATPDALALVEQELGRRLQAGERAAAQRVCDLLGGHPFKVRQAAADVGDATHTFETLAAALAAGPPPTQALADILRAGLSEPEAAIVAQLSVLRGETLGIEHICALTGQGPAALSALEDRRIIASGSPRFRLAGAIDETVSPDPVAAARALEWAVGWARSNRSRPAAVLAEAPALLALWRNAVEDGRDRDVIVLGRAIDVAFVWGRRWSTWEHVLQSVLRSARITGDQAGEAWALHALGTRAYALGDPAAGISQLTEALGIRAGLGDRQAEQATRHNLDFIAGPPPPPGHGGGGDDGGSDGGGPFGRRARIALLALAVTIGAGGAVAIATTGGNPSPAPTTTTEAPTTDETTPRHPPTPAVIGASSPSPTTQPHPGGRTGPTPGQAITTHKLTILFGGSGGGGTISGSNISCTDRCVTDVKAGTQVRLAATDAADDEHGPWMFIAWSGACTQNPCSVTMDGDRTVTALFAQAPVNQDPPTVSGSVRAGFRAQTGNWASVVPITDYAYQWQVCSAPNGVPDCQDVPGETQSTWNPASSAAGRATSLAGGTPSIGGQPAIVVTATNVVGATKATSGATVAAAP